MMKLNVPPPSIATLIWIMLVWSRMLADAAVLHLREDMVDPKPAIALAPGEPLSILLPARNTVVLALAGDEPPAASRLTLKYLAQDRSLLADFEGRWVKVGRVGSVPEVHGQGAKLIATSLADDHVELRVGLGLRAGETVGVYWQRDKVWQHVADISGAKTDLSASMVENRNLPAAGHTNLSPEKMMADRQEAMPIHKTGETAGTGIIELAAQALEHGDQAAFVALLSKSCRSLVESMGDEFNLGTEAGAKAAVGLANALKGGKPTRGNLDVIHYETVVEGESFTFHVTYDGDAGEWRLGGL